MTTIGLPRSAANEPRARRRKGAPLGAVLAIQTGLLALSAWGSSYYLAGSGERARHALHDWLRPSGHVGQSAGLGALLIFLFLWLYPLRKRVRWLAWTGAMARWLDVHVAAALVLPVLAAVHAAWRFEGVIGLGYWSMIVVCLSGIVGRYLYVHIPRSASGLELSAEEIAAERRRLLEELAHRVGLPAAQVEAVLRANPTPTARLGVAATLRRMLQDELDRWRAARALRRLVTRTSRPAQLDRGALRQILRLARREMALVQQARILGATHRVFRLWHIAHRPFALAALAAVLLHVGVAVAMGMTWLR